MRSDRLIIIGAGPVGLAMAAALRREAVAFDHVDANGGLGGNWHSGVYDTTHIVSSKRSTAFADYPMPADYPGFPSARQMQGDLESYARDRGLAERIEWGRRLLAIMRLEGRLLDRRRTYRPIALDLPATVDYREAAE